jgi:hypothetical protein
MKFTKASFLRFFTLGAGLLMWGSAGAQQASFAVAVTLHTSMSKPLAVAQLCAQQPRPIEMLGARIQVDCPETENGKGKAGPTPAGAPRPTVPEVLVTF